MILYIILIVLFMVAVYFYIKHYIERLSKLTLKDDSNVLLNLHSTEMMAKQYPKKYMKNAVLMMHKNFLKIVVALTIGLSIANVLNYNKRLSIVAVAMTEICLGILFVINLEIQREWSQRLNIFFNNDSNIEKSQFSNYLKTRHNIYIFKQIFITILFVVGLLMLIFCLKN